jgi:hypothetical protein
MVPGRAPSFYSQLPIPHPQPSRAPLAPPGRKPSRPPERARGWRRPLPLPRRPRRRRPAAARAPPAAPYLLPPPSAAQPTHLPPLSRAHSFTRDTGPAVCFPTPPPAPRRRRGNGKRCHGRARARAPAARARRARAARAPTTTNPTGESRAHRWKRPPLAGAWFYAHRRRRWRITPRPRPAPRRCRRGNTPGRGRGARRDTCMHATPTAAKARTSPCHRPPPLLGTLPAAARRRPEAAAAPAARHRQSPGLRPRGGNSPAPRPCPVHAPCATSPHRTPVCCCGQNPAGARRLLLATGPRDNRAR